MFHGDSSAYPVVATPHSGCSFASSPTASVAVGPSSVPLGNSNVPDHLVLVAQLGNFTIYSINFV